MKASATGKHPSSINSLLFVRDQKSGQSFLVDTGAEVSVLPASADDRKRGATGPAQPIDLQAQFPDLRFDTVHNTYRDVFRTSDAMTRQWLHDVAAGRPSTPDLVDGARVQHLIEVALASADDGGRLHPVRPPRS